MKRAPFKIFLTGFSLLYFLVGSYFPSAKVPQEKHEVDVRLIQVDVIVKKDGKFVYDLTKDDFEIYEDGKRVPINSFELLRFRKSELDKINEGKESPGLPTAKNKLVVIFDGINTWQPDFIRCAPKILKELRSFASSGNEVMILHLSKQSGLQTLQAFTSDEQLLSKAIDSTRGQTWRSGRDDLKLIELLEQLKMDARVGKEMIERALVEAEENSILTLLYLEKQKFEATLGGLLAAFNAVKHLPGRKSILLVSDGLPEIHSSNLEVIRRQSTRDRDIRAVLDALTPREVKIGTVNVFDPLNLMGKKDFKSGEAATREVIRYANSHNISVYSFDPAPTSREELEDISAEFSTKDTVPYSRFLKQEKIMSVQNLEFLSKETSATIMRGGNKYDKFRQVLNEDMSSFYLLSFYPKHSDPDGKSHKIKVKVRRKGLKVYYRKGYTDYTEQEEAKMSLVSAFYNPTFYKELPFDAEFFPFFTDTGDCVPWIAITLPSKEFFIDRFIEYAPKKYTFQIWMKERIGGKIFGGQFQIPFNINEAFMEKIKTIDNLRLFFRGHKLSFSQKEVQVIYCISDPETNEIGTWDSSFMPRKLERENDSVILNCIPGEVIYDSNIIQESDPILGKDGSLELGQTKFFPKITALFKTWSGMYVFLQAYLPEGKENMEFYFSLLGKDQRRQGLSGELVVESWSNKHRIWNGIFFLDLLKSSLGENFLSVEIENTATNSVLTRELKLTILE